MIGKVKKKIYKYAPKFFNFLSSPLFFLFVLAGITLFVVTMICRDIFQYELNHAYTADTPLYWAVGRGMLNGLTPYSGMYENKPVGVFLITALSFALTGDTIICNVFSCIAVMIILLAPAIVMLMCYHKYEDIGIIRKALAFFVVMLSCSLLAVYAERRAGGFQAEAVGSAASVLYICIIIRLKRAVTKKKRLF